MELFLLGQTFDCQNIAALRLHRKHRARLHRCVVEHYCAGSADARLASNVSTGQPYDVPKKMHQQQPRLHVAAMLDTVDTNRNLLLGNCVHLPGPYLNDTAVIKFFCRLLQIGLCSDTSTPGLVHEQERASYSLLKQMLRDIDTRDG